MGTRRVPATGMQLDRCDVCGNEYHRRELVRTQVEYGIPEAYNYLSYSSYNTSGWTVDTAADAGSISYGNRCDHARTQVPVDQPTAVGTMDMVSGVQTWTGDGVFRANALSPASTGPTTVLTFSGVVGPHLENTSPTMTVKMGVTNSAGSVKQVVRTWTLCGQKRVWFAETASVLQAYGLGTTTQQYYYIEITNDGNWWIDELQLEEDTVTGAPEVFAATSGAAYSQSTDSAGISSRKVCPSCFEYVFKKSQIYGRTDEPQMDYPVPSHAQEF